MKRPIFEQLKFMLRACVLSLLLSTPALALTLPDKPLILPTPMMPNVIITMDESVEMWGAFPPFVGSYSTGYSLSETKRQYYSPHYNPVYYNPNIKYEIPKRPDGTPLYVKPDFNNAPRNAYNPSSGKINLGSKYRPVYGYDPTRDKNIYADHPKIDVTNGTFSSKTEETQAYYYRFKSGCDPVSRREDESCYELVRVSDGERENFAIWYSYYRTRYLASITAVHLAMQRLEGKIRLAWQGSTPPSVTIGLLTHGAQPNYCKGLSGTGCRDSLGNNYDNRLDIFTGGHKDKFYKWLSRYGSGSRYTYMRAAMYHAANHLSERQKYCDDPRASEGPTNPARSCRDNIHIIVSDGVAYDDKSIETDISWSIEVSGNYGIYGEYDLDSISLPAIPGKFPMAYTPRSPYMDYPLKDNARKWECYASSASCSENNFFTGYAVEGPSNPPGATPSEYDNANTFADFSLYYWLKDLVPDLDNDVVPYMPFDSGGTEEGRKWNPRNDPANWQHLVNYYVVSGMRYVLGSDWQGNTYDGPHPKGQKNWPYVSTGIYELSNSPGRIYDYWHGALNSRGQFYGADRVDELVKALQDIANRIEKRLAASASIATNSSRLDTGTVLYQARFTAGAWSGELIANNITPKGLVTGVAWQAAVPPAGSRNIVAHDGSAAQALTATSLLPDDWDTQAGVAGAKASEVLAWLRGDQSQEQTFDGDGNPTGGKYRKRSTLLGDIVNSEPVYVDHQDYGYASLPEGAGDVYKNFVKTNKDRVKMLYVGANDGMLHGFAAGAGTGPANACGATRGQEVFAYIPNVARKMLPTLANPDYGRPGGIPHRYYVDGPAYAGDAFIGGQWRTILIGTTGAGGRTVFALDVTNPCDFDASKVLWELDESGDADLGYTLAKPIIARLNNDQWAAVFGNGYNSGNGKAVLFVVDLQTGALIKKFDLGGTNNGLSAPSLYDADGNGTTDTVYAGDLEGNLWKFDLSSANPADWAVAFSGSPLFKAVDPNEHAQPITAAPELGRPITGASGVMVYFGTGRFFADGDQSDTKVQSLYGLLDKGAAITGRSELVEQSITTELTAGGRNVRKASVNAVSYESKRGWYIDLNFGGAKGERVVSTPRRVFGRIFYTTMVPSQDPCKFGGTSWLMELDPYSGAMPAVSIIDVGGEVLAGIMSTVGIVKSFEFLSGAGAVAVGLGSTGATEAIRLAPPVVGMNTGRVSWREIID